MYYLSDICSLCLVPNQNMKSTVSKDSDGTVVEEKLRCFLIEIVNYKPDEEKYICETCLIDINYIYKFRLKCLKNITKLNNYAPYMSLQTKIKSEKEHSIELQNRLDPNKSPEFVVKIKTEETQEHFDPLQLGNLNNNETCETEMQKNLAVESVFIKEEPVYEVISSDSMSMDTTPYENFREFNEEKHIIDENSTRTKCNAFCSTNGINNNNTDATSSSKIIESEGSNLNEGQFAPEDLWTPPDILEPDKITLLPEKSKEKYEAVYKAFTEWQVRKNVNSFSENVVLAYFGELSQKYKSSSLWAHYSMLRSTLSMNNNVSIENYTKLRAFLKRQSEGYTSKKAKTFAPHEINRFINDAPDSIYLATKVAFIMGIMGACRAYELNAMTLEDINDLGTSILVTVRTTKSKIVRKFTITGHYYPIFKKYAALRPANATSTAFFLNYRNGKCTVQKIGINKFGSMGKQVATFLRLPNPERYTGHSFRRSSATFLVETGGDITALKRHRGGWKSISVAKDYIDNSVKNTFATVDMVLNPVQQSTSTGVVPTASNSNTNYAIPPINIINFSNVRYLPTINFVTNNK